MRNEIGKSTENTRIESVRVLRIRGMNLFIYWEYGMNLFIYWEYVERICLYTENTRNRLQILRIRRMHKKSNITSCLAFLSFEVHFRSQDDFQAMNSKHEPVRTKCLTLSYFCRFFTLNELMRNKAQLQWKTLVRILVNKFVPWKEGYILQASCRVSNGFI